MNSKISVILCLGFAFLLNACGEKKSSTDSPAKASAETISSVRYLGIRLLDLTDSDPKVSPLPSSLAQEFKECKFSVDVDSNQTLAEGCSIHDLAPTYKQRQNESLDIIANTPRCCLGAVTISPNQLTYDNTLDIFKDIPNVIKSPASCKNIEAVTGSRDFFVVAVNGVARFTIQEETDGGSGGSQTTTTVYFGMPTPDCEQIARIEQEKEEKIRAKNLALANDKNKSRASSLSSNEQPKNKNNLFDSKTGITLNKDSKDYNTGGCLALLAVRIEKGELKAEDNTEAGNAWIRSQGRRGADLMAKFKATPEGTSLFQTVKDRILTNGEAEFLAGYMTMREGALKSGMADRALASLSICGEAGYHKRF